MVSFKEFCNESQESIDKFASKATALMDTIETDGLTITDFGKAVAKIVIDEYGSHNYDKFINTIRSEFNKEEK